MKSSFQQFRALSAHLESVREAERTRIAREVHDELGQALTGLKMDAAWLIKQLATTRGAPPPHLLEKVRSMTTLIDTTIQTVRQIASDLRPGLLDDFGLEAAIEWQLQDFQTRAGIPCEYVSNFGNQSVSPTCATGVFRILQETLTNVARHAEATLVEVNFKTVGDDLLLEIGDNGKGIRKRELARAQSLGLLGMRERARLLGGQITIRGREGKGTLVKVRIPLNSEVEAL